MMLRNANCKPTKTLPTNLSIWRPTRFRRSPARRITSLWSAGKTWENSCQPSSWKTADVGMISPGIFLKVFYTSLHQLVQDGISEPSTGISWRIFFASNQGIPLWTKPRWDEWIRVQRVQSYHGYLVGTHPVGNLGMVSTPTRVAEVVGSGNTLCFLNVCFEPRDFLEHTIFLDWFSWWGVDDFCYHASWITTKSPFD